MQMQAYQNYEEGVRQMMYMMPPQLPQATSPTSSKNRIKNKRPEKDSKAEVVDKLADEQTPKAQTTDSASPEEDQTKTFEKRQKAVDHIKLKPEYQEKKWFTHDNERPRTPNPNQEMSKRRWEKVFADWRACYTPPEQLQARRAAAKGTAGKKDSPA
mmetsp:Transcript_63577/g.117146  ORF Transcript_63577/g.117146 Transcript_63577/m.117146 type:complete len:157 (-) Transcript_63577:123-593(-)